MSYKGVLKLKELKQLEDYYKNNEIDMDAIIEDFTPYITTIINNGTNCTISFEDKKKFFLIHFLYYGKTETDSI